MQRKCDVIYETLLRQLRSGEFIGGRLPPERELAQVMGVSQGTLRVALRRLEADDLIERIPSLGTFSKIVPAATSPRRILNITSASKSIDNPYLYSFVGMTSEAQKYGCEIVPIDYEQVCSISAAAFSRCFPDGEFIGAVLSMSNKFIQADSPWRQAGYPLVAAHVYLDEELPANIARVAINIKANWRIAVQHLLDLGHRRIAVLSTSLLPHLRKMEIPEYRHLLAVNGADSDPALIGRCRYDQDDISRTVNQLLDLPSPPTALLCFSDFFALYAYQAIKARGYSIPTDIAVMGTCGYPGAEFSEPPLSTVSYNYFDCGAACVALILNAKSWFQSGQTAPVVQIPGTLIARASTQCRHYSRTGLHQ